MKKLELNQMEGIQGGIDKFGCATGIFFTGLGILGLAITGFATGGATVVAALGTIAANTAAGVGLGGGLATTYIACTE